MRIQIMIDPTRTTNYQATDQDLQEMIVFWILAAGKSGVLAARIAAHIRTLAETAGLSIFKWVLEREKGYLRRCLRLRGMGCWTSKSETIDEIAWHCDDGILDLRLSSHEDLQRVRGIGPKTARCFVLHSRRNAKCIGLDTHMLFYLQLKGYEVPHHTPSNEAEYRRIEQFALHQAAVHDMNPAEFDLAVWNYIRTFWSRDAKKKYRTACNIPKDSRISA